MSILTKYQQQILTERLKKKFGTKKLPAHVFHKEIRLMEEEFKAENRAKEEKVQLVFDKKKKKLKISKKSKKLNRRSK